VTIKAIRADCSESTKELRILQHIQKNAAQHPGRKHLPELLDHFYEGSSEKKNLFLVLELLGPMVRDVVGYLPGKRFSPSSASQLSRQLFLAIDCLHSQGIVHGGKILMQDNPV
jgi:serine/threonine protein kinase